MSSIASNASCPYCGADLAQSQRKCWLCLRVLPAAALPQGRPALSAAPELVARPPRPPAGAQQDFALTGWVVFVCQTAAVVGAFAVTPTIGAIAALVLSIPIAVTVKVLFAVDQPAAAPNIADVPPAAAAMGPGMLVLKGLGIVAVVLVVVPLALVIAFGVVCTVIVGVMNAGNL